MTDPRFFPEATPLSVKTITDLVRGEKHRGSTSLMARMVATPESAEPGAICFAQSAAAAASVADEKGVICLATPEYAADLGRNITVILTPQPKSAFGQVLAAMYPPLEVEPGIASTAVIAEGATIASDARIDGGVSIGAGADIGAGAWVKSGVAIGEGCVIGAGTMVEANASVSHAVIGANVLIGPGVRIGFTGFGVGREGGGNALVRHLGKVVIGDNSTIGSNTTIDRGFLEDTVIGAHVMIDNLVHIAHNCTIGDGNVICGQVGIAGSTVIGDNNIFGAQSGVADHITIGSGNVFAARAGVTKSTGDGQVMAGFPAVAAQDFRRQVASLRRLATPRKTR